MKTLYATHYLASVGALRAQMPTQLALAFYISIESLETTRMRDLLYKGK